MDVRRASFHVDEPPLQLLYERGGASGSTLVGTVRIPKDTRVPFDGHSVHPADEFSYLIKGRIQLDTGEDVQEFAAGTFLLIPAGQPHCLIALEDAQLLWWWLGRPDDFTELKQMCPFGSD